jgi:5-methylcytosine-specific restriction endonuclease McrA
MALSIDSQGLSIVKYKEIIPNGGQFTVQEWLNMCELYNQTCLRCGTVGPLTADHIIPISKGGQNVIENIQPLCKYCNSTKGTQSWNYKFWFAVA